MTREYANPDNVCLCKPVRGNFLISRRFGGEPARYLSLYPDASRLRSSRLPDGNEFKEQMYNFT